ncbi:zinc-binding dehydrogenase [uncultured Tessaracoccus sp.]|uniref:zinc-dependent alcohol dehydrogenase n=1 Tax=uncultured Tessaracoccus sp. TaxID=905023 RepID=UPI002609BA83|nr:alcohol dehydrogenase catalytic domain-containing protein [uncultured Tessaracoccus sp.]
MTMRQMIMPEPGKVEFREAEIPSVGPGEVKLRIRALGICGSDIHVFHGTHPYTGYPVVQGHEVCGDIVEVAPDVRGPKVGDRVVVQPQVACGTCEQCVAGLYHICDELKVMGFQTVGLGSDFYVLPAQRVTVVPEGTDRFEAAALEPLAVAVHAVDRVLTVEGKAVLVIGGGPVGNLTAQVARAMGASKVILSELSPYRRDKAAECDIALVGDGSAPATPDQVRDAFGGVLADIVFECVGAMPTVAGTLDLVRKGGTVVVVGVVGELVPMNMGFVQDHELTIFGSAMYQDQDFVAASKLVAEGKVNLKVLVSRVVPFEQYPDAYRIADTERNSLMKVYVDLGDAER